MARHIIHQESKSRKEKGRREWFHNWDYIYDDETDEIILNTYESVEEITVRGPMETHRDKGTEKILSEQGLPEEALRKLKAIRSSKS